MPSQIDGMIEVVHEKIYTFVSQLKAEGAVTEEPVKYEDRLSLSYREYKEGECWGELFDCAWFHVTGRVPEDVKGKHLVLQLDFSGEGLIFDADGCPVRGITNVSSHYDYNLGMPGKRIVQLTEESKGGEIVDLWVDCGCNDLFGNFKGEGKIIDLKIAEVNDKARNLYYDMTVLRDMLGCIDAESPKYYSILYALQDAVNCLSDYEEEEYDKAMECTRRILEKEGGDSSLTFYATGHAHIDLAWLWPIRETKRKGARTFSTQLELLERNPDYVFGASQPQLYQWMKEDYPLLYEKIKEKVKTGQWELQGGTWVEMDTYMPSGESLVRQMLYGQRFFQKEFGQTMKLLWLPDVFGYSAALPQLMKKAGYEYFTTIKLSWSMVNKFPYHTFNWRGLDNSEVFVHMPPEDAYGSAALPRSFVKAAKNYQEKGLCDAALTLYGISDGGGGCGPEHMERIKRVKNLEGLYPVKPAKAIDFFEHIDAHRERYDTYKGELYVERHQGTLTTQAKTKKFNRKLEILIHNVELAASMAMLYDNEFRYPEDEIENIYKEVLLYQFHDILPGSSIKRVYDECEARFAILEKQLESLLGTALQSLKSKEETSYMNLTPFDMTHVLEDGIITIPAMSMRKEAEKKSVQAKFTVNEQCVETKLLRLTFNENGEISSFYDKEAERELVKQGETLNQYNVFSDVGDAWDFQINYRDKATCRFTLTNVEHTVFDNMVKRTSYYKYHNSEMKVVMTVNGVDKLVTFAAEVDWNEKDKKLRAEFPLAIRTDYVDGEIQFGHLRRSMLNNTSIDYAQIEFVAHKWVDMSEEHYGVALLNDCKYGHYAKYGVLSLNLLRSQNHPGVSADIGRHEFQYALYPHSGNLCQSDVREKAYALNNPAMTIEFEAQMPFVAASDKNNIVIETVKKAQDSKDLILRIFENRGEDTKAVITLNEVFERAELCDLLENETEALPIEENRITLDFHGFEVHTIKVGR